MTNQKNDHLDENGLLVAIVDETDLPDSRKNHLSTCSLCRGEKERLEKQLVRLGHMAERFSPPIGRRVRLPASLETPSGWWSWRGVLAAGMATAAVVLMVYGSMLFKTTPKERLAAISQETEGDERFMMEVGLLTENALPGFWLDIAGEYDPDLDEEFMDFVVPSTEDDIVSLNKEGILC